MYKLIFTDVERTNRKMKISYSLFHYNKQAQHQEFAREGLEPKLETCLFEKIYPAC